MQLCQVVFALNHDKALQIILLSEVSGQLLSEVSDKK